MHWKKNKEEAETIEAAATRLIHARRTCIFYDEKKRIFTILIFYNSKQQQ